MKLIVLESFEYNGAAIKEGILDGSESEMLSMQQFGRVRPATSTEIECAEAPMNNRETATVQRRQRGNKNA